MDNRKKQHITHIYNEKSSVENQKTNEYTTFHNTDGTYHVYLKPPPEIVLGTTATGQKVQVSDETRQSGMYILGVQGRGKSSLLENLIYQDIKKGYPVIVLDPHGDLIDHAIAAMPPERLQDAYVLDMEDEAYPFGINLLTASTSAMEQIQTVERIMHVFEAVWGDVFKQQNLPRYLRAGILALLENDSTTLVNLYDFLLNDTYRKHILHHVTDASVLQFWQTQYEELSQAGRKRETASLVNRLEALFMGRPLIKNILGQSTTTINFRRAIEHKEILFLKLPIQTLKQDASLIGTMLIAQLHATIFSFKDVPLANRPTYSIFIDEFQHFVTPDIEEIYTGGRKFGSRLCVAHQIREQIPRYLAKTTIGAQTIICFQTTHDDAADIAPIFTGMKRKASDFVLFPLSELDDYPHQTVKEFWRDYIYKMGKVAGDKVKWIKTAKYGSESIYPRLDFGYGSLEQSPNHIADVLELLNTCIYESEKQGKVDERLQEQVREAAKQIFTTGSYQTTFQTAAERVGHTIFMNKVTTVLAILIAKPITADKDMFSPSDISHQLQRLAHRQAYVKIGMDVFTMRTNETPLHVPSHEERRRREQITEQTREKYCRPAYAVEQEIRQQLATYKAEEKEAADQDIPTINTDQEEQPTKWTPFEDEEETNQRAQRGDEQEQRKIQEPAQPQPAPQRASMDRVNTLYTQLKAKDIDTETAILASLGEHYVMTIAQWMRLFSWGSYPRATKYFKDLREQGNIIRKDREGRGGTLVTGDWFFLSTKGANELIKRKQAEPTFKLEPNEIEKASGDTLLHTYLVNEILIAIRLLERTQPQTVTIEQLDHERSIRRTYQSVLGADAKFYPDGYLRLLVPTQNGLKRQYMFLELQQTTQKNKASWQATVKKYLDLFSKTATLEIFFHSKTPQVLVITMDADDKAQYEQWTDDALAAAGDKGKAYSNRFTIGTYAMSFDQFLGSV